MIFYLHVWTGRVLLTSMHIHLHFMRVFPTEALIRVLLLGVLLLGSCNIISNANTPFSCVPDLHAATLHQRQRMASTGLYVSAFSRSAAYVKQLSSRMAVRYPLRLNCMHPAGHARALAPHLRYRDRPYAYTNSGPIGPLFELFFPR